MKRRIIGAAAALIALAIAGTARAQGPQIDVASPPGVPDARGTLGPAIGASGTSSFDDSSSSGQPIGGRPGPSVSRAPVGGTQPSGMTRQGEGAANFKLPQLPAAEVPQYGDLDLPANLEDIGPPDGLTLDGAIEMLIRKNLNLMALRYEIPMAQADILTAGLRANPIFYADGQLVPYGTYSNHRPGGQRQFDVNVTIPLDVTGKRKARKVVAQKAKQVTEAQFQDAVRQQIDNLYTAFVDVVAATETLKYSQTYERGIYRLLSLNQKLLAGGQVPPTTVDTLLAQHEQAQLQVREAEEAVVTTSHALGLLLDIPQAQSEHMKLRSALRDVRDLSQSDETLIQAALGARPDLLSFRIGIARAHADVHLARANRYSDVYLLYQPYTFQDNSPFGLKSAYSYAVGVTATVPVFNRNQGNIERARINERQTKVEEINLERQVANEVVKAAREFRLSLRSVLEIEREVIPAQRRVRVASQARFERGEIDALVYLEAQREYNQVVRAYRDALVRHRRAMLDLNTAVGLRIMP